MQNPFNARSTATQVLDGLDLRGRTLVLTGANSGLGLETLTALVRQGAHVLALARTRSAAEAAARVVNGAVTPLECDLGDGRSVQRAIAAIETIAPALDGVVANAGIMRLPTLETIDGLEKQFVVNYLGHFQLINGLVPVLRSDADARVVIVASEAHRRAPRAGIELGNLSGANGYSPWLAYGQSNVARILFARALARRLRPRRISVNSLHPGVIGATRLFRHTGPLLGAAARLIGKSIAQGAATQCFLAAHPDASGITGEYFKDCRIAMPARTARDDVLGETLWSVSQDLIARRI